MNCRSMYMLLLLFTFKTAYSQHSHYPDKPNTHGMLLMGQETVYGEHLPMFHTPHDYQIILELEFPKTDLEKYRKDRIAHPQELVYTIEPETFVLPEMVNHTKVFKASVYRGHFERGGIKFLDTITLKIKKIIYYKQFDKNQQRPEQLQYILFGNKKEQFLSHLISKKPDFNEVLAVQLSDMKVMNASRPYQLITFEEKESRKPFSWAKPEALIWGTHNPAVFKKHKQLYLEFGDLE
ncbi:hypothetical protein [Pedobacter hiemivivus]|uniref:Uncharacterized protein n=1 Tax=Pedobacter hiemivivus TaxID=2530454 RepID=A0A4R0N4A0_9SPHI|nr:hypothetical protein [Pedobacter hiemivivus]TCC93104.1 hypothetical protein EZ444_17745 [Pedobacter hiemivivus]